MEQQFCEVENTDPAQHQKWIDKHQFDVKEDGSFLVDKFEGKEAVTPEILLENIRTNVKANQYKALSDKPYDERTFVMVCGGPSLASHLEEIRAKSLKKDEYLVVCSNMTGSYLLENGIVPHVHFILDPQEKKKFDVTPDKTSYETEYWINAACHPSVFAELNNQGIKPYMFLADFAADGSAIEAVKESLVLGQPGMMAVQGGTMAGLRAINIADAMGFRKMEYYGFDACVEVKDGRARPYAYEKKRGEAILEISCDLCDEKFDSTLIFQKQVNEFILWQNNMPWIDISIIGGGLIAHYQKHIIERKKEPVKHRYTEEYKAIQKDLHRFSSFYGTTGPQYSAVIFHGVSQLAKRLGEASVLDYGSASGSTFKAVRDNFWLPPTVTDKCYDPFLDEFSAEPEPADFVICTDVMEHVEPECTHAVLDHIQSLTKRIVFFSISMKLANKNLSDGRNAHINIRDSEFWLKQIKRRFVVSEAKVSKEGTELMVIAQSIEDVRQTLRKLNESI